MSSSFQRECKAALTLGPVGGEAGARLGALRIKSLSSPQYFQKPSNTLNIYTEGC